jgi:hypothetical protein
VGRSPACDLCLPAREVSKQHALLIWNGRQWALRDLHSKNGSWYNTLPVAPGRDITLSMSSRFAFGDPEELWRVVSLDPPEIRAASLSDQRERTVARDLLVLPSEQNPQVTLFRHNDGWMLEREDGQREPVQDHQQITIDSAVWIIYLPEAVDETWQGHSHPSPQNVLLRFHEIGTPELRVSYVHEGEETILDPRVHLQLLAVLAEARVSDQLNPSLPVEEHGWLYRDELTRRLQIFDNRIYVYVFRAREQLAAAGIVDAVDIVERRSDTRQVRLGVPQIDIVE